MSRRSIALLSVYAVAGSINAFVIQKPNSAAINHAICNSKKSGDDEVVQHQQAFAVGTFVEFTEKKRTHVGKIDKAEHKANGGARYTIIDSEGKKYDVRDKAVLYAMACPNTPKQAETLYQEFCEAQDAPTVSIQEKLDINSELLEMAWEEAAVGEEGNDHLVTANSLIESIHAHTASTMEKYLAWKLLKTDIGHIFFKEIKDHGRVVAFKAKTQKAVNAAKEAFCNTHSDNDICFV